MAKYKLTVTDTETGDVCYEFEAKCIIAGISNDDERKALALSQCNINNLACAVASAREAIKGVEKTHPELGLFVRIIEKSDGNADENDPKED